MAEKYRGAYISEIHSALNGKPIVDLYVHIEHANKYLIFLRKDQILSPSKQENLSRLSASSLFVREEAVENEAIGEAFPGDFETASGISFLDPESSFRNELLGPDAAVIISESYKLLVDLEEKDKAPIAQRLINMSDKMLEALAPETEDLKKSLVKNLVNLQVMGHAAGITTITLLVALANEFTSRTALKQITQACVLMDVSLGELEPQHLEQYYLDRKLLPGHIQEIIKNHPVRSHQLLSKFPEVSDSVGQLILLHHELHNGKGYHRGIRTSNVLPLARVLSLGVDIYEMIKSAELNKLKKSMRQIFIELREPGVEPHHKRHSISIVDNVIRYLRII